ncbi:NAD-binding protein [Saccharopolyspora spinosa]|uniref:TrkA family protein n=1 Tax=Saccharopolyspora spinosa TaxID=60894 RepID=A0A2N3XV61_SACSN|nr:NAD-binding protein [Saccharopolyspora spinosa]PKW14574.1 TrkA family protein [Saccharopolyspora spinosa]
MNEPVVPPRGRRLLVVGDDEDLGRSVAEHAESWGNVVQQLHRPDNESLRQHLRDAVDGVAVVSRDDIVALRYTLLVEHLAPGVRLVVTIFDHTVASEISRAVPNCTVLGMTDAIVPTLLGACVAPELASLRRVDDRLVAVQHAPNGLRVHWHQRWPRSWKARVGKALGQFRPMDGSSQAMLTGLTGLLLVAVLDTALGVLVLHEHWSDAAWHAVRTLTTVGSAPAAEHAPDWYKALSAISMLAVLGLAAMFTAGLVDRLTSRRFTALVGSRAVPRRNHVVVVGLGQVGLRLCSELQALGIGVVAVERDYYAPCLPLARALGIPVVVGRGGDRFLLRRLLLPKARAIAAVSSDGLENIAVAVAARAIAPHQRIVLRAGGDDVTTESRSLFRIGAVCDVTRITGPFVAARLLEVDLLSVFAVEDRTCALFADGQVQDLAHWAVHEDVRPNDEKYPRASVLD